VKYLVAKYLGADENPEDYSLQESTSQSLRRCRKAAAAMRAATDDGCPDTEPGSKNHTSSSASIATGNERAILSSAKSALMSREGWLSHLLFLLFLCSVPGLT